MSFDRESALSVLIREPGDYLIVAGLGNAVFDIARLTGNGPGFYPLDGAMGSAVPMGLGLALAQPGRRVLVVTGDGELLMNLGALATVAVRNPPNLSIVCLDNQQYALTGGQATHTAFGTDIAAIAAAAGIRHTARPADEAGLRDAARLLAADDGTCLVVVPVTAGNSARYPVDRNGDACRTRFRSFVVGDEVQPAAGRS